MSATQAEMVAFEDLRYSNDCVPKYRNKVALTFVVTPEEARRFRIGTTWTLTEAES